jgi:hypothetical protein
MGKILTLWLAIIDLLTNIEIITEKGYKVITISTILSYETLFYSTYKKITKQRSGTETI